MSLTGAWAQSCSQPSTAILNFRGRVRFRGLNRKYSWIARQYGATSNGSDAATPAYGQAVTLRTLSAHAPRVVMPTARRRSYRSRIDSTGTQWIWMSWRVVTCAIDRP
jgi:hypothetical protein